MGDTNVAGFVAGELRLQRLRLAITATGAAMLPFALLRPEVIGVWAVPFYWLSILAVAMLAAEPGLPAGAAFAGAAGPRRLGWMGALTLVPYALAVTMLIHVSGLEPPAETPVESAFFENPVVYSYFALMAAVWEELFFRGIVYTAIERGLARRLSRGVAVGCAVTATVLWFGVIHGPQMFWWWPALLVVTGAGLMFTLLRALTGSVLPCIAAHVFYNATILALGWAGELQQAGSMN